MEFLIASNNKGKIAEMETILGELDLTCKSQAQAGFASDPEENGSNFEENAYIKAKALMELSGMPVIADDSGLEVDWLEGAPGILSARYGGDKCANDKERYELLLSNLQVAENRSAKFVCCIVCLFPNGDKLVCKGECAGSIAHEPRGNGGFGYDPIFIPQGSDKTMAELGSDYKNSISHRHNALINLKNELRKYYDNK